MRWTRFLEGKAFHFQFFNYVQVAGKKVNLPTFMWPHFEHCRANDGYLVRHKDGNKEWTAFFQGEEEFRAWCLSNGLKISS